MTTLWRHWNHGNWIQYSGNQKKKKKTYFSCFQVGELLSFSQMYPDVMIGMRVATVSHCNINE